MVVVWLNSGAVEPLTMEKILGLTQAKNAVVVHSVATKANALKATKFFTVTKSLMGVLASASPTHTATLSVNTTDPVAGDFH